MIQAILATDLTFFSNLKSNQFKIIQVPSARFCQFCRNVELSEAELRIFNQLLDRQLRGKSIGLVESQRSRRATNLKNSLMPRALAVFPVVSKNIGSDQNNNHLYSQLPQINSSTTKNQKPTRTEQNKYREYDKIEVDLRKLIFKNKALESLLFSRKKFLESGVRFKARMFSDEQLAGLLKAELKMSQLEALQKSIEFVTGSKLTSNLRKNYKSARNLGLKDAGIAGEIHCAEIETAKYWQYTNIKELCELLIQRARSKALLAKHTNQGLVWKFSIGSDKAGGVHYTHLSLDNTLEPATSKTSLTI